MVRPGSWGTLRRQKEAAMLDGYAITHASAGLAPAIGVQTNGFAVRIEHRTTAVSATGGIDAQLERVAERAAHDGGAGLRQFRTEFRNDSLRYRRLGDDFDARFDLSALSRIL